MSARLVILTHEYPPFRGGVGIYCHELAQALLSIGVDTAVMGPRGAEGVRVWPLSCGRTLSPIDLWEMSGDLWKQRERLRGGVLLLGSYGSHLAVLILTLMGRRLPCRIWSLLHGSEVLRFSSSPVRRYFASTLLNQVEMFFVNSCFTGDLLKKTSLAGRKPIILAPCAPSHCAIERAAASKKPSWERFRILTLARIHPRKGQLDTARALGLLPPALKSSLHFVIGGRGDDAYLSAVVRECTRGMISWEYIGPVENESLASTYASCDCFLMTSRSLAGSVEGFGISYLEAAWHGKPSIAFATGGVAEAVRHGETGFVLPEGDVQGVAEAVGRLMNEPDLRERMGSAAAGHAREFTWEKTARVVAKQIG